MALTKDVNEKFVYSSLSKLSQSHGSMTFDEDTLGTFVDGIVSTIQSLAEENNQAIVYKLLVEELTKVSKESVVADDDKDKEENEEEQDDDLGEDQEDIPKNQKPDLDDDDDDQGGLQGKPTINNGSTRKNGEAPIPTPNKGHPKQQTDE